jgi:hypothetical protein
MVLVAVCGGCTLHIHLEAGVRHDGNAAAIHGGVALGVGGDSGSTVRTYQGFSVGGGADADETYGASGTITANYLGGGPGPLLHGARFTGIAGHAVKLGGGLSYPIGGHQRATFCLICKADREPSYTTSFGAVGLQASGMADSDGPGIAGDVVLDLVY